MHSILLNFAGGINLAIGGLIFFVCLAFGLRDSAIHFFFPMAILFISGGVFLYAGNKSGLDKSFNKFVLISGIANIFTCNIVSAILGILGYTMLPKGEVSEKNEHVVKEKKILTPEEKEARRLRNILSLGVGLVVLAGVIFATSTWETLTGASKTIILIFAAILFYLVSALAENKLNLKVSGMMYYGLSNVLIIVSLLAAGYFEVFGRWFSLSGEGNNLFITVIWIVVAFFSYIAYIKYDMKHIWYLIYFSVFNIVCFGLMSIFNSCEISFFAVSLLGAIGCLIKRNSIHFSMLNKFSKVILPIISAVWFFELIEWPGHMLFNLSCFAVFSITFYCLSLIDKNKFFEIFAPISTLVNAVAICQTGIVPDKVILIQIAGITAIIYALGVYKKEEKSLYVSAVISNLAWLYVVIAALDINFYGLAVVTSLVMLAASIIFHLDKSSEKFHFEKIIEPIKVFLVAISLNSLIDSFNGSINIDFGVIMSIIFLIMYLVRKDLYKFIYFILCCFTTLIVFFSNFEDYAIIANATVILISVVLLITACLSDDKKYIDCKEGIYAITLLSIYSLFEGCIKAFINFSWWFILGLTIIYIVAFFLVSKNNIMKYMSILALIIPYYLAVDNYLVKVSSNYYYSNMYVGYDNGGYIRTPKVILESIPWLFMIVIYTKGFLKSVDFKIIKVVEIVALSVWYLSVLATSSMEIGLFIGIVALISILVGYRSEKYVAFYYTGIAFTIINLLIQLKDVWSVIPIWAYILVAGLVLIGVVTYKEYVKNNPKIEEVVPDIIEPESNEVRKMPIDSRTVTVGSIIYFVILCAGFISSL